jgi:hypothetical protein
MKKIDGAARPEFTAKVRAGQWLIVLSQKVACFYFENQLFEKIQDWRTRC